MPTLQEIKAVLKSKVLIDRLELEDITPDDIDDHGMLFGEGLGLDSVEALDVLTGIEEEFGIAIPQQQTQEEAWAHFRSVETLSQLVQAEMLKQGISAIPVQAGS